MLKRFNLRNFILISGQVAGFKKIDNTAIFFIKSTVNISVKLRDRHAMNRLKDGDWVCVRGKLRHSTEHNTLKVISGKITPVQEGCTLNVVFIEGYTNKNLTKSNIEGIYTLNIIHLALNRAGEIYTMPLKVAFNERKAKIAELIMQSDTLFEVEGRLGQNKEFGYYLIGDHVINREPIMREV